MEMTRRQLALSIATASAMGSSLFEPRLSPLGVPRGVVPGRVTWAHDPAAVTWDGTGSWWIDDNNNQAVIDRMVSASIRGLTDKKDDAQAWSAIFHYFNRTHDRGNAGYRAGEKIAIKANLNNTVDHGTIDRLNSSPHLILSLVRQLTGPGRVAQTSITVFDSSRFIPSNLYDTQDSQRVSRRRVCGPYWRRRQREGRVQAQRDPFLHSRPQCQRIGYRCGGRHIPHQCCGVESAREFGSNTLRKESIRRHQYLYRLAQERPRWIPPQP